MVRAPKPFLNLWLESTRVSQRLTALTAWGLLFGYLYKKRTGYVRGAVVVGLLVLSHWVLDVSTHRPDMPLYPGSVNLGLGLWNSVVGTLVVEGRFSLCGWRSTCKPPAPRMASGGWGFRGLSLL